MGNIARNNQKHRLIDPVYVSYVVLLNDPVMINMVATV